MVAADSETILSTLSTYWNLTSPLSKTDIHFHADWYDSKQIKPQITVTGPIASPITYFGPPSGTHSLHLLAWQKYVCNTWVLIPRGEDDAIHHQRIEEMRKEAIRILNLYRDSYTLPLGLVFPLDEGRPQHELDRVPRLLRYEILVQANRKHT